MKLLTVAEICPDPAVLKAEMHLTSDLEGWNSDHPLFQQLIEQISPKTIIEVGTWKGRSALHMVGLTKELGTKIYCCDTWLGEVNLQPGDMESDKPACFYHGPTNYYQFLYNVWEGGAQDRIHPILNTSTASARLLNHFGVRGDLIYIDADHHYETVFTDLEFFSELLAPGGIMFGDDWNDFPGVKMAVSRFAFERNLRVVVSGPAWVLQQKTHKGAA